MIPKLNILGPHRKTDRGNFKLSNMKVGLLTYFLKGFFKTITLIEVVLTCDNYLSKYRILQKSYLASIILKICWNVEKINEKYHCVESIVLVNTLSGSCEIKLGWLNLGAL